MRTNYRSRTASGKLQIQVQNCSRNCSLSRRACGACNLPTQLQPVFGKGCSVERTPQRSTKNCRRLPSTQPQRPSIVSGGGLVRTRTDTFAQRADACICKCRHYVYSGTVACCNGKTATLGSQKYSAQIDVAKRQYGGSSRKSTVCSCPHARQLPGFALQSLRTNSDAVYEGHR